MEFEKIKELIAYNLAVNTDEVAMESDLVEDLGADSLDMYELIMAAEDTFDIEISDEEFETISTVADFVALIKKVTN